MKIDVVSFEEEAEEFLERELEFKIYSRHRRVVNIVTEGNLIPLVKAGYYTFPGCIVLNDLNYFYKNNYGKVAFSGRKKFSLKNVELKANIDNKTKNFVLKKIFSMRNCDDNFIKENLNNWDKILGVGEGLTPKGDDYILGYSIFSKDKKFKDFFLKTDFRKKTNMISAHFLEMAKKRIYSETILNFISGKDNSLLRWGATSGLWCAFGIVHSLECREK